MRRGLAVVVSCTSSKRLPVSPSLRVAALTGADERLQHWRERLDGAPVKVPVRDLYAGAQWSASLELESCASTLGFDVDLWVVSAGLGLVPATTVAPAYAASFSPGPDLVATTLTGRRAWWQALSSRGWSVDRLALLYDQLLVVLAPSYLDVMMTDLAQLRRREVVVVSSRRGDSVYSSNGLRSALGASAMTLNARAAAKLLELAGGEPLASSRVRARWDQWSTENAKFGATARREVTDDEVTAFIEATLADSHMSRSALLQKHRAAGRACEESRFRRLYEAAGRCLS